MGILIDTARVLGSSLGEALIKASNTDQVQDDKRDATNENTDITRQRELDLDPTKNDPKSLLTDPFTVLEQLGFKDRPSPITYKTLKAITYKMDVVQAIILTRQRQVAAFAQPSQSRYDLGFRVKLRDSAKEPSKKEIQWAREMEAVLMQTGVTDNPRLRDDFETFLVKLTYDALTYDQMCFEIVPNNAGKPAEWYAVDASTFRLADSGSVTNSLTDPNSVRYVQIYDGMVINEYTPEELCFGIRNARTDIALYGYGVSELEMLMHTITSYLWAYEYNQKFFSQGSMPKGIINFKGTVPGKQLEMFRRQWYQMLSGVANAFRTPITNSEDEVQYINMQSNNRDMEYNAWMDFLIKITCGIYQTDPAEINFKYGNEGVKSTLSEDSNKEKITESKARGLYPLLKFIAKKLNEHIIWPINEDFEFTFVGLDSRTKDEQADLNTKLVKTTMTINELRAQDDLPPLPGEKGDIILDPTWMQFNMAQQGGEGEGEGGPQGEGESSGDEPDFSSMFGKDDEDGAEETESAEPEETEKSFTKRPYPNIVKIWEMDV